MNSFAYVCRERHKAHGSYLSATVGTRGLKEYSEMKKRTCLKDKKMYHFSYRNVDERNDLTREQCGGGEYASYEKKLR